MPRHVLFQSTLPLRGATVTWRNARFIVVISIHAPLAGSDPSKNSARYCSQYFNPRSPCGERPAPVSRIGERLAFQSTLPLRGATANVPYRIIPIPISIHAPLAGSDASACFIRANPSYFNPRSPCGERRRNPRRKPPRTYFNPRSPCGERPLTIIA